MQRWIPMIGVFLVILLVACESQSTPSLGVPTVSKTVESSITPVTPSATRVGSEEILSEPPLLMFIWSEDTPVVKDSKVQINILILNPFKETIRFRLEAIEIGLTFQESTFIPEPDSQVKQKLVWEVLELNPGMQLNVVGSARVIDLQGHSVDVTIHTFKKDRLDPINKDKSP